jgi:dihydropteroate synthase
VTGPGPSAAVDRAGSGVPAASRLWRCAGRVLSLDRPCILGIVNLTPDSFSDGGRFPSPEAAVEAALAMEAEGADVIDVGGESTRPGAEPVPADEEIRRVLPFIERAAPRLRVPLSVDTTKVAVARAALDAGAAIVNDISGLRFEPALADLCAERGAGLVLMHIRGTPRTMQENPRYEDVVAEVTAELRASVETARARGCADDQLVVDPGIGFGKTAEHNLVLLNRLDALAALGRPILVGPSRKSFIGKVLDLPVGERLEGTLAACVVALCRGARCFRVHDVRAARRALDLADAILRAGG